MNQSEALLDRHALRLAEFTEALLRPYLVRRRSDKTPVRSKEFNDPVWGTLKLRPIELVVLDSPLLQRLRRIKQLGVVHLVYTGATHTRLEHSLGAAHQVEALALSLAGSNTYDRIQLKNWHIPLLRLAAICHDVGHGLMSHVSENALEQDRESNSIRLAFQTEFGSSKLSQLSEIAAYYMIGSPAFLDLLRVANERLPGELPDIDPDHNVEDRLRAYQMRMQKLVIGHVIDDDFPLLHELISGPFDGDKLDYMTRDAYMCGVPVVTDVARLILKVRLVNIAKAHLPRGIASIGIADRAQYSINGIARSGARTLDELALGRALLFDKIYRHQKVRAAEAMVASLLNELIRVHSDASTMIPHHLLDDDLLALSKASVLHALGIPPGTVTPGSDSDARLDVAVDLAHRLRDRRLLVRGFAFSSKMPMDPYRNDSDQHSGVENFNRLVADPERRGQFVRELVSLATEIATVSDQTLPGSLVPFGRVEPYVWISAPVASDGSGESIQIGHAWLLGEHGEPIRRADEDYAETRGWSDAYVATRDLGLIFCPQEMAPCIYLAAEALVRTKYGIRTPQTMRAFAKQDPKQLRLIQERLYAAGWYANRPRDLAPEPAVLLQADTDARLEEIMTHLRGYSGPLVIDPSTRKRREAALTKARIRSWLRQFDNDLVDGAIQMLAAIKFIGRDEVNAGLDYFLARHPEFHSSSVVPLGQPKDSSSVITYFVGDVARRYGASTVSLDHALLDGRPILMVDDFVGRGSAAITVFEDWLGVEPSQNLGQGRGPALSAQGAELLRRSKIGIVFATGFESGATALRERLGQLGFADVVIEVHVTAIPKITDEQIITDANKRGQLVAFCRQIGLAGLVGEVGRSDTWAADRSLGYGNDGLLLVSSYNTPTAAVTCLWHEAPGWTPLIPRRSKT